MFRDLRGIVRWGLNTLAWSFLFYLNLLSLAALGWWVPLLFLSLILIYHWAGEQCRTLFRLAVAFLYRRK